MGLLFYFSNILLSIPLLYMGLKRFVLLDKAARILLLMCFVTFIGELIAAYFAFKHHNNLWVYNILDLLFSILTWYYFQQHIPLLQRRSIQYACVFFYVALWLITSHYTNFSINMNIGFVSAIGITTIIMSIVALDHLIAQKKQSLYSIIYDPHFWFSLILLAYWSFSLMQWMLLTYLIPQTTDQQLIASSLLWANNLLNISNTIVFYAYPKMIKKNAR